MLFKGVSVRFSTENEMQYEAIGTFWDVCAKSYGIINLRGLGYNWTEHQIEYVIGLKDNARIDIGTIQAVYKDAVYKEIILPDDGWVKRETTTQNLAKTYDEIYEQGPLSYEIETFDTEGKCEIAICRQYPKLVQLTNTDIDEIMQLYQGAIGSPGCVWDSHYPSRELLLSDIERKALFGIKDDEGNIIAAVARDEDEEVAILSCWMKEYEPAAELARLVVNERYKNQGLARVLLRQGMEQLKKEGYRAIHFLVAEKNEQARRSYQALNFQYVGETDLFEQHFLCYEKKLL